MEKFVLFLLGIFSLHFYSQSVTNPELKATRSFYYVMDYKSSDSLQTSGEQLFVLNYSVDRSLFSSVKNIKRDSILELHKNLFKSGQTSFSMKGIPRTAFTYYIEKKSGKDEITNFDQIGGKNFIFKENGNKMEWKMFNEKKTILGFICTKATLTKYGRNFTAWFAVDIPISDGPYKFYGLPGLIVEVYDDSQNYRFHLVNFDPLEKTIIQIPTYRIEKAIFTDKKQFMEGKMHYNNNVVERARSMGLKIEEQKAKILRDKTSRRMIPLELKYD